MNRLQSLKMKLTQVLTAVPVALLIGLGVMATLAPQQAYAKSSSVPEYIPSEGTRFWVTFLSNNKGTAEKEEDREVTLVAAGRMGATLTLKYSKDNSSEVHTIPADGQIKITLEKSKVYNLAENVGKGNMSVLVVASDTISLYAAARDGSFYESTFVLPEHALGKEYVVQTGRTNHPTFCSEYAIVATEDGTNITINQREAYGNSAALTVPGAYELQTLTLNKGEVYFVKSTKTFKQGFSTFYATLSGTTIVADKRFALFQADEASRAPYIGGHTQNYLLEQALPISSWGKEFIVSKIANLFEEKFTIVRITAAYDSTIVTIRDRNGKTKTDTLNAFSTFEHPWITSTNSSAAGSNNANNQYDDIYVTASQPVTVSSFVPNNALNNYENQQVGAPAVACIPPLRQGVHKVTLGQTANDMILFLVNIVVPTDALDSMKLDGSYITSNPDLIYEFEPFPGTKYSVGQLIVAEEEDSDKKHVLSNNIAKFVLTSYGLGQNNAYYYASGFNTAPAAPIVKIGGKAVEHNGQIDYCNRHPGIKFTAEIDYPHDSVRWTLGEDSIIVDKTKTGTHSALHQYGLVVNEEYKTHHLELLVYHSSPITHEPELTDTVHFDLNVYPAFYDTLKTKVAAKHKEFVWDRSSNNVFGLHNIHGGDTVIDLTKKFGIPAKGAAEPDLVGRVAPIRYNAADSTKANTKIWTSAYESVLQWTDAHASFTLFDSLFHYTQLGPSCVGDGDCHCDSIFYLQLEVVPDIIMKPDSDTVCQVPSTGTYEWVGHHNPWNNLSLDGQSGKITTISTATAGEFVIRDTMESKVFPYPDSIHVLYLKVYDKPEVLSLRDTTICEGDANAVFKFTMNAAAETYDYELRNSADELVGSYSATGQTAALSGAITLNTTTLADGTYTLHVIARTPHCDSDEQTATLTVNNRPWLNITNVDNPCWPAEQVVVKYAQSGLTVGKGKIFFSVDSIKGSTKINKLTRVKTYDGKDTLIINTDGWLNGKYTITASAQSEFECDSLEVTETFWIYNRPEIYDVHVYDTCLNAGQIRVSFKAKNAADTYKYSFGGTTWLDGADKVKSSQTVEIALPDSVDKVGKHTLKLQAFSASHSGLYCESEIESAEITIHPLPTVVLKDKNLNGCYSDGVKKTIEFQTLTAQDIIWVLLRTGETDPVGGNATDYVEAASSIELNSTNGLTEAGEYTFQVLAIRSEHGCEVTGDPIVEKTFTLNDQAHIAVASITGQCEGKAVEVPVTNTWTDKLEFTVKTGSKSWSGTLNLSEPGDATERVTNITLPDDLTSGPATLEAGDYTITVTCDNANHCAGNTLTDLPFTVYTLPTVQVKGGFGEVTVCEGGDDAVFEFEASSNAATYSYTTGIDGLSATNQPVPANKQIKITLPNSKLPDGSFTLSVTVKSDAPESCDSEAATATLNVTKKPSVEIGAITPAPGKCHPVSSFTAAYTPHDATTIRWWVEGKTEEAELDASKPLKITTTDWTAKEYTLHIIPVNGSCNGGEVTKKFRIYATPTAGITSIESKCAGDDEAKVVYTSTPTSANKYDYYVYKEVNGAEEASPVITSEGNTINSSDKSFMIDISGQTYGTYWLHLVTRSDNCSSEEVKKKFYIYALPKITPVDTTACEGDEVVKVRYTSARADKYAYTLTGEGIPPRNGNGDAVANGYISVNTSGLGAGTYTISVTASHSTRGCETASAVTATITLLPQPDVTLGEIADFCEGVTSKEVTYTDLTAGANYDYKVTFDDENEVKVSETNQPGASPIVLTTTGWKPGAYTMEMVAKSTAGCGSVKKEQHFTIIARPTITLTSAAEVTVCEGKEDDNAVFTFTITGADNYDAELVGGSFSETNQPVGAGSITVTIPNSELTDGTFELQVTARTAAPESCETVTAAGTAKVIVNPQPEVGFAAAAIAKCAPIDAITVPYTPSNATSFTYTVKNGSSIVAGLENVSVTELSSGKLTINTTGWEATTYTVEAQAKSVAGCLGEVETKQFTIITQPTVENVKVKSKCKDATTAVTFDKNDAATDYEYWIFTNPGGVQVKNGTGEATGSFDADIDGLVGPYTLRIVTSSGTCTSDPVEVEFDIYPLPSVTLNPNDIDVDIVRYTSQIVVPYTSSDADTYTYTLVNNDNPSIKVGPTTVEAKVADDSIRIPSAELPTGVYTLTVSAVSADGCDMPTDKVLPIEVLEPTAVEIDEPIAEDVCFGSAAPIEMTVHTQYADSVNYVVTFGGSTIAEGGETFENKDGDQVPHTFILDDISDKTKWAVGTYQVTFTALNTVTHTVGTAVSSFEIYKNPSLTPAAEPVQACVNTKKVTVTYPAGDEVDMIAYRFVRGETEYTASTGFVTATGTLELSIEGHGVGEDTLYLQPKSKHGCEGGEVLYAKVVINPLPTIELDAVAAQCYADLATFNVGKTPTGADKITYVVKNASNEVVQAEQIIAATANMTVNPTSPSKWAAGTYTIEAYATSAVGCEGAKATTTFTIHPNPTIDAINVASKCVGSEATDVTFETAIEEGYYDYIVYKRGYNMLLQPIWNETDVKASNQPFTATTKLFPITLEAPSIASELLSLFDVPREFKVELVIRSKEGCQSEKKEQQFSIYPLPEIAVSGSISNPVQGCVGSSTVGVSYTSSHYADSYTYTLEGGETKDGTISGVLGGIINVNTAGLDAGTYKLTVTPHRSDPDCDGEEQVTYIKLNPKPELELASIDAICENHSTDITATITTLNNASTYDYVVLKGSDQKQKGTGIDKSVLNITLKNHTDNWAAGDYILRVTANSSYSCGTVVKDVPFTINPIPVLNSLTEKVEVCEKTTAAADFAFKMTGASAYTYYLEEDASINGGDDITSADGTGTITLDPRSLSEGTYHLHVQGLSGDNCPSNDDLSAVAELVVNAQPAVQITGAPVQACGEDGAELQVEYSSTSAHAYTCTLWNEDYTSAVKTVNGDATGSLTIPTGACPLGTYHVELTVLSENGCPSKPDTVDVTLKRTYLEPVERNVTKCYGEEFIWKEKDCEGKEVVLAQLLSLKEDKMLIDTLNCSGNQCIPIYKLNLTVNPEYAGDEENYTLCAGETLEWFGQKITKKGTYTRTVPQPVSGPTHGCDSVYRIVVDQIEPVTHTTEEIAFACYGQPVDFRGKIYDDLKSGLQTLRDTLRDDKCDTAYYEMQIIVGENHYYEDNVTACGSYTWPVNGETYKTSGQHIEAFKTTDGHECDSIHVLNLTINPSYDSTKVYTILENQLPYTVHGKTYQTAVTNDVITYKTKTGTQCDSIYRVTIIVSPLPKDTAVVTICKADAPYNWVRLGKDYGSYNSSTEVAKQETDSVHVLQLTVVEPEEKKQKVTACESYTWDVNGETYTTDGERTFTIPSLLNGCDSIVYTLDLTIDTNESETKNVTVCQGKQTQVGNRLDSWENDDEFSEVTTKQPSGCTVTTTYKVHVVNVDRKPKETATICQGDEFPWRGSIYTEGGIYGDTVWSDGCPIEIYTLELTANKSYKGATEIKETAEVHENTLPYKWEGHKGDTLLMTDGDYYDRLSTIDGCDSIVHLHFHVGIVARDTVNKDTNPLRGCESVDWEIEGRTYTITESRMGDNLASDTVWYEKEGKMTYDKIHYCYVEVYQPYAEVEEGFSVCQDEEFKWHGESHTLTTAGSHTLTYTGHNDLTGCDSTFTVTVYANETLHETEPVTVCPSELPYKWTGHKGDTLLYTSGTYTDEHTSVSGCDSTYVINFQVTDVTPGTKTSAVICQNNTYTWQKGNETLLTITGNEVGTHTYYNDYTSNGCPMKDTLLLTVTSPTQPILTEETICYGEHFEWKVTNQCNNEEIVLLTGNFTSDVDRFETLHCGQASCDPIYHLVLHVRPEYAAEVYRDTLCPNGSIVWRGMTITKPDTYVDRVPGVAEGGCDSVYRAIIAQKPTTTIAQTRHACQGETVTFGSKTCVADKSIVLRDTIFDREGCDSVYLNLTLNVSPYSYDSVARTECGSYTWPVDGETYSTVGTTIIRHLERDEYDCVTAEHVLRLTIEQKPADVYENYSLYENQLPFTVRNQTYTAAVSDAIQLVPVAGGVCDTTVHVTITVSELPKDTLEATLCASELPYIWRGTEYTAGGWHNKPMADSVHILHLTVNPVYDLHQTESSCGDFVWDVDGKTYTASGDYTYETKTAGCNCDSIVTLHLTVGYPNTGELAATACENDLVTFGKATFLAVKDTTFKDTIMNSMHCDSVITYTIAVSKPTRHEVETGSALCEGESFPWRGKNLTTGGLHFDTVYAGDCVSEIYAIDLTMNLKHTHAVEDVQIPEQLLPYEWHGQMLTENGDYTAPYSTINGCDSSYYIHFHVNMVERITDEPLTGCDSVTWRGRKFYESGAQSDTVFLNAERTDYNTIHFCDITINKGTYVKEDDIRVCQGAELSWHGQTPSTATPGTFTLRSESTTVEGCAAVIEATLYVNEVYTDTKSIEVCPADLPYEWTGHKADTLLRTSGVYVDQHKTINGCDSTYTLTFTVKHVTEPDTTTASICQDQIYTDWKAPIYGREPGTFPYYDWYLPAGECDSTYHLLLLTVDKIYDEGKDTTVHVCQNGVFNWYGIDRTVEQIEANLQPDGTYMQIFDTVKNSVYGCDSLEAHLTLVMHMPQHTVVEEVETVCNSIEWGAMTITQSGIYDQTFVSAYGCNDSTVTREFVVYHSGERKDTITACDTYYWPVSQQDLTESDDYEFRITHPGILCDSVYYLHLTINNSRLDTLPTIKWCEPTYKWGETGETYTKSGYYKGVTQTDANGCEQTHVLRLELPTLVHKTVDTTACNNFEWKGANYPSSIVFTDTVTTADCDSIIYTKYNVTVKHVQPTEETINACGLYEEGGVKYTDNVDLVDNLVSPDGCEYTHTRHIVVSQPDTITYTLIGCASVTWKGETFDHSQKVTREYLCDSVVVADITINFPHDSVAHVTEWDSYTWTDGTGETYTESGRYSYQTQTTAGCDSLVTLHLTINRTDDSIEVQNVCEEFFWDWTGSTYDQSGEYRETKQVDDRDSTRILQLTINHPTYTALTDTACDYYVWFGTEYTESGTYLHSSTENVCLDVDTLHLTINYTAVPVEYYDTACDVLTINGKSYYESTTFTEHLLTENGCDSTVNYHLTINKRQVMPTVYRKTCGAYTWEGATYDQSGSYTKVLTGANGCDSVVTLVLSIFPSFTYEFDAVSCDGHYVWDNTIYETEGDHERKYTSVTGCDSIVTMHLSLPEAVEGTTINVTACDEYWWNGVRYTETGSYTHTFTSVLNGCDSIEHLHLNMGNHPTGEFSETAQERYTWNGKTYYETGDYQQTFRRDEGCDSIVTLHLTITNPLPVEQITKTACDAFTWDTETFYESGTYTRNIPTADGRDSIVSLTLVINSDTTVTVSAEACGQYIWNGKTYDESGTYYQVLERGSGCDSTVTLNLTIYKEEPQTFVTTARDVYTWNGETFTESGTYTRPFTTEQGCESTTTLVLTIISNTPDTIEAKACHEYEWADSVYTKSTIHSHVFPATNGSDSIVTLSLEINESKYTDLYDTVKVCDPADPEYSATYTLPWGMEVGAYSAIYYDTLTSAVTECDSIVRFHLQWCDAPLCIDTFTFYVNDVCNSYIWEGTEYTTSGTYERHYRLDNGCDSVSQLRLDIRPKAQHVTDLLACDSLYWDNTNTWYYESGFYYDTLVAANGCDSIEILHAVIGHAGAETIEINSCDALTINGETLTETGVYVQELKTVTGCDSTLTINLTIHPSVDATAADTACDSYQWYGLSLTETGFYPQVLTSEVTGCDSIVDMHLIVYESKEVFAVDSLHCDSIVWGDEISGIDTIYTDGLYTKTFHTVVGCDSTVTMDLRLKRHDEVTAQDTAACDSLVWNGKVYFESGAYRDTLVSSRTGCDSIVSMYITINPTYYSESTDSVAPPFYIWPLNGDTLWSSGDYTDTVAAITTCDSIVTLHLIMTDSIILDSIEPVRVDTFGYCPGDTAYIPYNLLKGHPNRYTLIFDTINVRVPEFSIEAMSVTDTANLPNHGLDSLITVFIPDNCPAGTYCATLQLFDDFSSSEEYRFCLAVNVKGAIVSMWTDVVAINNHDEKFIGYQWFVNDVEIAGATKQYYCDYEDLNACYRARVQLADSSWVFTCDTCFDLRTDSLELIAYPTPAPVGQPVTIKAMGINLEKLPGSLLTITNVQGLPIKEFTLKENERGVDVNLPAGLYIAKIVTGDADDKGPRTANVKFTVF